MLDHGGEVYSLPRMLSLKTKDVRARLGDGGELSSVADTRKVIGERMTPAIRRHVEESRERFRERSAKLGEYKAEMTWLHRKARVKLEDRQKAKLKDETRERHARLPKGLRGLWHRLTGKYQAVRKQNETEAQRTQERQARERQTLIEKQLEQRAVLQTQSKDLRHRQAEQLLELRKEVGRCLRFTRDDRSQGLRRERGLGLSLER